MSKISGVLRRDGSAGAIWIAAGVIACAVHAVPMLALLPALIRPAELAGGAYFVDLEALDFSAPSAASAPSVASMAARKAAAAPSEPQPQDIEEPPPEVVEAAKPQAAEHQLEEAEVADESMTDPKPVETAADSEPTPAFHPPLPQQEEDEVEEEIEGDSAFDAFESVASNASQGAQDGEISNDDQADASAQGDPRGEVTADEIAAWRAALAARLEQDKRYPPTAERLGQEGIPVVFIRLDKAGSVLEARLEESCGHRLLDIEAVNLVRRASLPPPPASLLNGGEVRMSLPILFERNY